MSDVTTDYLSKPMDVGGIRFRNRVLLAPMSGVTDVPFRNLTWEFGAGMVVSEMVASEALLEGEAEMQLKILAADMPIHMVQLAGREAKWMALAAKMAEANGADIIDINMGCPARRVTTGYSGSALMRDLDHAVELIRSTVDAVNVPVTLKMRLGWDHESINAPELAKRAEDEGVQMITVHGRTRCQFYKGSADWNAIQHVRNTVSLPLVVNGDIEDSTSASIALKESGADAIMVGRGAYGAPWVLGHLAGNVSAADMNKLQTSPELALRHHQAMLEFYGEKAGIRQARKHLGWYFERARFLPECASIKRTIMTSNDGAEIRHLIEQLYTHYQQSSEPEFQAA
jgi:tRNA-dihydrouridine synthase B